MWSLGKFCYSSVPDQFRRVGCWANMKPEGHQLQMKAICANSDLPCGRPQIHDVSNKKTENSKLLAAGEICQIQESAVSNGQISSYLWVLWWSIVQCDNVQCQQCQLVGTMTTIGSNRLWEVTREWQLTTNCETDLATVRRPAMTVVGFAVTIKF